MAEVEVKHGVYKEDPRCKICGAKLTHEWLDGDYTLSLCPKPKCWETFNEKFQKDLLEANKKK